MENQLRKYQKQNFDEDGKISTVELRDGRSRADAYYQRGNTIVAKSKQLHTSTGAHVKVLILPTWKGENPKVLYSFHRLESK